jgi:16S rRNA (guanine527-N7)-methyltransferase
MLPNHETILRELAIDKLGIHLDDKQVKQFSSYADLLIEWNEKVNLTSIIDPQEIIIKHFLDSLTLGKFIEGHRLADIGTGAGFPGIPLKILLPDLELVLVDSLAKRLDFLKVVVNQLGLHNVVTVHSRAEDFGRDSNFRDSFDCVTSRAVARLPILLEYAIPLLKRNGIFLAAKGTLVNEEVLEAKNALKILGANIREVARFSLGHEAEHRAIVIVEKIRDTPKIYPRKSGTPSKKPL